MAKIKISQFDTDPANNTDIDGINLAEGMAPGLVNNAIRTLMAQLKNQLTGTDDDNRTIGGNLVVDGTSTLTGNSTVGGTLAVTGNTTFSGTVSIGSNLADAFPSGTKMLFNQTSAPVGWVKDVTHDNKALRVVTGTAGTGGSVAFTTAFASQNVGDTTLTASQIPSHSHTFSGSGTTGNAGGHSHSINDPGHLHDRGRQPLGSADGGNPNLGNVNGNTATAFTGISINAVGDHAHSVSVSGTTGSLGGGTAHSHTINLAVQYVDVIICTKS
jgi:microcystin-dependent protein